MSNISRKEVEVEAYNQEQLRSLQAMSFYHPFLSYVLEKEYEEHAEKNSKAVELLKTDICLITNKS